MDDPKRVVFLVVDDDGQVREILVEYLKSFGFENILLAKNGKAALKILQNNNQKIDVVICDWEMPHLDGLTLLNAVRKDTLRQDVKFIMVSSQSSKERVKITKAAKSHVDAYIVKPFRSQVLKEKVDRLLRHEVDPSAAEFEAVFQKTETMPPATYDLKKMDLPSVLELCKAYQRVGWLDKSIVLASEAIEIYPSDTELLFDLAQSYFFKSDYESASEVLQHLLKLNPDHIEAKTLYEEVSQKQSAA